MWNFQIVGIQEAQVLMYCHKVLCLVQEAALPHTYYAMEGLKEGWFIC